MLYKGIHTIFPYTPVWLSMHPNGATLKPEKLNAPRMSFADDERAETDTGAMHIATGAILIVIALVIAFTVLPVLNSAIETFATDANTTSTQATLARLTPLVVIAGIVVAGVGFLVSGVRKLGS